MLLREWRDYYQRDAEPGVIEIAIRALSVRTDVIRPKVTRRYVIRRNRGLGRNVIEEVSAFVESKNKD